MDDDELSEMLASLEAVLVESGLAALVEQERAAEAEGRTIETMAADSGRPPSRRDPAAPKPGDIRRESLSVEDRLSYLLDMTEAAVSGALTLELRVADVAGRFTGVAGDSDAQVVFSDPLDELSQIREPRSWKLSDERQRSARRDYVSTIVEVVGQLRATAGLSRGPWLLSSATTDRDGGPFR